LVTETRRRRQTLFPSDTTRARIGGDVGYELRFAETTVEPFGHLEYIQDSPTPSTATARCLPPPAACADKGTLSPNFNMGESCAFSRKGAGIGHAPWPGLNLSLLASSYTPNGRTVSLAQLCLGNLYVPSNDIGASVYRGQMTARF
jgi:hypothetical protein